MEDTQRALYESIINYSDDAIFSKTLDGTITSWNKGAEVIFGYTSDEIVGQNISALIPMVRINEELEIIGKIRKGELVRHYETERIRKDGRTVNISLTVSPLKDKNGVINGASGIARESEKKYYNLFHNYPVPTWVIDQDTFKFLDVNKAAVAHYGYSYDEFLSMTAVDIRPHDEKKRFINLDRSKDHFGARGLWKHIRKDGTIINVEISLDNIIFDGRPCSLIVAQDITEKTEAEDQLKHATFRLQQAQSIAHIGSWELNFATGIRVLSDESCRIYGLSVKENILSTQDFLSFVHPDDLDEVIRNIIDSQASFGTVAVSYRIIRKDGTIRHIYSQSEIELNAEGKPVDQYGIVHDVTEQNLALEQNLQTQQRYKQVVENILDGLMIDDPNGKVLFANDQFLKLFGLERRDLNGLVLEDYIAPEFRPVLRDRHNRRVAGEDVPDMFEYQGLRKDGSSIWLEVRVCKVFENGAVIGTQSAIRDITDRKKAEEELSKFYQLLEQKVKDRTIQLEALNHELESFSYSVAHDLRAPLRIINGYSEILKKDYGNKLDAEADRLINVIVTNTQRMGKLIDEILNLARLGRKELAKQSTDMNSLVRTVIAEQLAVFGKPVQFDVANLPGAICDNTLIRQVWSNLLSNAIKYSGKQEHQSVIISSSKKDDYVVYSVQDNGVGFDMAYSEKLFGVFQRLHKQSEFEGTGVGLALVERIVTKHGGKIWAESEEGKGATFYFSLPIMLPA